MHDMQNIAPGIIIHGDRWGKSTCFIGAVEGSSRFDIADLQDLGINSYRIYGGMSRWAVQDVASPTIVQIKANPNVINWTAWDYIMTHPVVGSDYWWVPETPRAQINARTLFHSLQVAGIRPILTLRNRDSHDKPSWSANPPQTQKEWDDWWKYVFATVYWLDVRNHYSVNDFEVHNEPDNLEQGWNGTQNEYFKLVQYTHNAIDYIYRTYLPGRNYHVYGPVSMGNSNWPSAALQHVSSVFDSVDIHDYDEDISSYVEQIHAAMNVTGHANAPLWLSEWGSYAEQDKYNRVPTGIMLINNLIRGSQPGNDFVFGSHVFSLYDYGTIPYGLISSTGVRRTDYYAMRMAIRALQGCRPTYRSQSNVSDLLAITTRDRTHGTNLLITNQNSHTAYQVDIDISALLSASFGLLWQFDASHHDQYMGKLSLKQGHVTLYVPANSALLVKF